MVFVKDGLLMECDWECRCVPSVGVRQLPIAQCLGEMPGELAEEQQGGSCFKKRNMMLLMESIRCCDGMNDLKSD